MRLYALVPFITIDSFEPFPDAGKWENNRSTRIVRDLTSPKLSRISVWTLWVKKVVFGEESLVELDKLSIRTLIVHSLLLEAWNGGS